MLLIYIDLVININLIFSSLYLFIIRRGNLTIGVSDISLSITNSLINGISIQDVLLSLKERFESLKVLKLGNERVLNTNYVIYVFIRITH